MEANIDGTLNTMRANIDGTLKDMRAEHNNLRTDIERMNTEAIKREKTMTLTIAGLFGLKIAILGLILSLVLPSN